MNWLTLELVKTHCRIDHDALDSELTAYAVAAEAYVLTYTRRTVEEILDNEDWRAMATQAALLLVGWWEDNKGAVVTGTISAAAYGVEALLKPMRRLT